jgi:hypothetical protein
MAFLKKLFQSAEDKGKKKSWQGKRFLQGEKGAALDFLTFYFTDSLQRLKNRRHFPQDKGATGRESRTFKEKLLCEYNPSRSENREQTQIKCN